MTQFKLACLVTAILITTGCQSVPTIDREREKALTGDLVVSLGVRRLFDDPEVEQLVAGNGNDIKCVVERRVGTHMVMRVCRTRDEWEYLAEQTAETYKKNRMVGVCGSTAPLNRGDCGEGRGGF